MEQIRFMFISLQHTSVQHVGQSMTVTVRKVCHSYMTLIKHIKYILSSSSNQLLHCVKISPGQGLIITAFFMTLMESMITSPENRINPKLLIPPQICALQRVKYNNLYILFNYLYCHQEAIMLCPVTRSGSYLPLAYLVTA